MTYFFIEPTNEGQALNYSETFDGTYEMARKRALKMKASLQRILTKGSIGITIYNKNYEEIFSR